jgi:23S rRNA-/tRNA-specific pseudouridylate synthase
MLVAIEELIKYEDEFLFVVTKPFNLHSVGIDLVNGTGDSMGELLAKKYGSAGLNPLEGGLINRLDYETSGLMIGAKDTKTYELLREMIQQGEIHKKYLALVEGELEEGAIVEGWIGPRHRGSKKVTFWDKKPKGVRALEATTKVIPIKKILSIDGEAATLVEVEAHVARRHQVRVSCAEIGAPLVGDALYGSKKELAGWRDCLKVEGELPAFFLHAWKVSFKHPMTGKVVEFESSATIT